MNNNMENPQEIRVRNIIDMGLTFSAMIRLFDKGTKTVLRDKIVETIRNISKVNSEKEFKNIHREFCKWGISTIYTAEKKFKNGHVKPKSKASYGQIAKTFDVVLKVCIYYSHLPNCGKAKELSTWLNAAVDTQMMAKLREYRPKYFFSWPSRVAEVDETDYDRLQELVRIFITEKHKDSIIPVQFDDIYWNKLNR